MAKELGILDQSPEEIKEPLTPDQEKEIENFKDGIDWSAKTEEEAAIEKEAVLKKGDEKTDEAKAAEKKAEEESAASEKTEEDRLNAKAEELEKTVDEVKEIEAQEKTQEDERIAKLAEEQGKTVEDIIQQESEAKKAQDEKTDEQKEQERLESIAKEEVLTVDEVKTNEEKDSKVVENYGKDPMKMAKALRKENSAYGKLKSENEKLVEFKNNAEAQRLRYNEERVNAGLEKQREKIVTEYIKIRPEEAEEEEGVLFERAKVKIKDALKAQDIEADKELKGQADESRTTLIENIPEDYKEYAPEIKEVLKSEDDRDVLSKGFDIMNLCYWARGKKMTPEYVKSIEDAAEKRGKEQSEIIEKKSASISSGSRSTPKDQKNTVVSSATEKDKERALEVFSNKDDWSNDKKIEEYMTNRKEHDNWD